MVGSDGPQREARPNHGCGSFCFREPWPYLRRCLVSERQHDRKIQFHVSPDEWNFLLEHARAMNCTTVNYIRQVVWGAHRAGPVHGVPTPGLDCMKPFTAEDAERAVQAARAEGVQHG